jgi:hypothetical protein
MRIETVLVDDLVEPAATFLDEPFQDLEVHVNETEAHPVAISPLEIIE